MTNQKKILLGILTFLPIFCLIGYIICFAFYFVGFVEVLEAEAGNPDVADPTPFLAFFGFMIVLLLVSVCSAIGLMVYYIIHANGNPKFDSNQKLIWILVLIFAGGIGTIVYYFVVILPKEKLSSGIS